MNRSGNSSSWGSPVPLKSKKAVQSTPKGKKATEQISIPTPDKQPSSGPPAGARRARNRSVALSVKEIRQAASSSPSKRGHGEKSAAHHQEAGDGQASVRSARRRISTWPEDNPTAGARNSKTALKGDGRPKIAQKYEMLGEFFDGLDSSIRLLRLKGSSTTLTNISPKIECLTDRRFTHRHLAQLKHILPEAIEIKRVLIFDERTSCMKPDLHVTLNTDAIQFDVKLGSESKNTHLRRVFRARLMEFHKSHPEEDDIPEEMLPEPFNRHVIQGPPSSFPIQILNGALPSQDLGPSIAVASETPPSQKLIMASHFSQAFQRHFSQKATIGEIGISHESSSSSYDSQSVSASPVVAKATTPSDPATPVRQEYQTTCSEASRSLLATCDSTPLKPLSTSSTPMSKTPALCTPKRSFMSPDDESTSSPNKLVRRPIRSRSLKFDTPVKADAVKPDDCGHVSRDDILNIFSESLLESIRERERKTKEEKDPAISQAKRRCQMIACLPKLFNMIHFLFQSIKRSVLTKDELLFKIIASHSDIVDSREVEEQLDLLLELAPEWISKKLASSGDPLICINKMSNPEIIRAQLEVAK